MRRNLAALVGALSLAFLVPGLASAHAHIAYQSRWRAWTHDRGISRWHDRDGRRVWQGGTGTKKTKIAGSKPQTGATGNTSTGSATSGHGSNTTGSGNTIDGYKVVRTINLTATAYGPTLQDNYPYGPVDAYGNPLVAGDVAVDPRVVPLGSWLWVQGYSFSPFLPSGGFLAHAVDTGGAIKGDRIDLFVNKPDSIVNNFGFQKVTAFVLNRPLTK